MNVPGWRDWVFGLKTFGAALLALYIALWMDLPRPYWALGTVYITSQVFAGATRSKAMYRLLGTFLGAAVTIIFVPNLVNAPVLLSLAIALWVGVCLYFSLLDRTPRGYVMMLAGYTAAIVGFPDVVAPEKIFDVAVARGEEIAVGILCASIVSSVVFPQSVLPIISLRLDQWIRDARGWVVDILDRTQTSADTQSKRLKLASDAIAFDALATPLVYEITGPQKSAAAMATLRQHMLMFLPIASSISDRIRLLQRAGEITPSLRKLLERMSAWLRSDTISPSAARQMRRDTEALDPKLGPGATWNDLVLATLLSRLRDFIDLRQDVRNLQKYLRDGVPPSEQYAFRYTAKAMSIRHRDHGMALLSAIGTVASILVSAAIWIATGWPDGSAAPMMAAVACCLFATFDDPAPYIVTFANSAIVGLIGAAFLLMLLPLATSFEMMALALAPWFVTCGVFMAQPKTAPFALGAAVNSSAMIAIQNGGIGEFAPFLNSAIAVVAGMWVAAAMMRLVRSVGGTWSAHRLRRINRASLAAAASRSGANHGLELAAVMLDRLGLIAPRLAALPPDDAEWTADLISEVRTGINVVELRRVRASLAPESQRAIERILLDFADHLRSEVEHPEPPLLRSIDEAIDVVTRDESAGDRRTALLGLVGLRRSQFPNAPAYRPASIPSSLSGQPA